MTRNWSATLSCSSSSSCCGTKPTRALTSPGRLQLSCPKTRTPPLLGGVNPSMSSSSVVFPAPFLPSTPMTSPGATLERQVTDHLLRAEGLAEIRGLARPRSFIVLLPFVRRLLTSSASLNWSCLAASTVCSTSGSTCCSRLAARCVARLARDRHRLAAISFEQALRLQQAVGLGNRHGIHGVCDGQLAHRRQLGAGRELAARDHAPHLLDDLAVDRNAGLRVEYEHEAAW